MTTRVLPFPKHIVPQEKYWDCGPAAAQVVLHAAGVTATEDELIRGIGTTVNGTDYVGLIERELNRRLPSARFRSVYLENDPPTRAQRDALWDHVRQSVDGGMGVVMNWVVPQSNPVRAVKGPGPRYGPGTVWHYVACMGYDDSDRTVLIADSGFSPYVYWVRCDDAAGWITPKGYCYSTARALAGAPSFTSLDYPSAGRGQRSRPPINFFLHTQEGDSTAAQLARYCDGRNNVSYHYTLRDGILCNLVDPETHYSWSVLSANVFSVNLCFAGSFARWSRQQWLERERDIEIAGYVIARDCRRLGIPLRLLLPPYAETGAGISDHRYVTKALGIGTHLDVGDGFPWDKLSFAIKRYSMREDSFMAALSEDEQREMLTLLRVLAKTRFPSRSPLRHLGEGAVDTVAGFDLNQDANLHILTVMELARAGVQSQIDLLREVAAADPKRFPDRQDDARLARKLLAQLEIEQSTSGTSGGN